MLIAIAIATMTALLVFGIRLYRARFRFSLRDLFAAFVLLAILVAMLGTVHHRLREIPRPIFQAFSSWGGHWTTPPMVAGEYWIRLDYEMSRLSEPLKLAVWDATTARLLSIDSWHVGAHQFGRGHKGEIVGEFRAVEGHRYRVEVDAEQVRQLAGDDNARLTITLTAAEVNNRIGDAILN